MNYLSACKFYPAPPVRSTAQDARNEKEFWEYVKADPRNMAFAQQIAFFIANVLEDGYIESRILAQFPGVLGYHLTVMREHQYKDMETVTQLIEREDDGSGHIFQSILQIMLSYALFGEIKYGETPLSDMRIQTVFQLIPQIDTALTTTTAKERWQIVSLILIRLWDHIEEYIELCKQHQDEAASTGTGSSAEEVLTGLLQALSGTSTQGTGSGTPVPGVEKNAAPASNPSGRQKTRSESAASAPDATENESGDDSEDSKTGAQANQSGNACEDISPENQTGANSGKQEITSEEGGRIPYHQTDSVSEPAGGETLYDDDYKREQSERAAADIERMLDKMAEKAACKQLENERIEELNETAQSISYGDIHSGVKITVHRIAEVDDELQDQYDQISAPLLNISRQLQRSLVQKLKDQQRGGKQTGLVMGRRLDAHALCRNDGKYPYLIRCGKYVSDVFGAGFERVEAYRYSAHMERIVYSLLQTAVPAERRQMIALALGIWLIKCLPEEMLLGDDGQNPLDPPKNAQGVVVLHQLNPNIHYTWSGANANFGTAGHFIAHPQFAALINQLDPGNTAGLSQRIPVLQELFERTYASSAAWLERRGIQIKNRITQLLNRIYQASYKLQGP